MHAIQTIFDLFRNVFPSWKFIKISPIVEADTIIKLHVGLLLKTTIYRWEKNLHVQVSDTTMLMQILLLVKQKLTSYFLQIFFLAAW